MKRRENEKKYAKTVKRTLESLREKNGIKLEKKIETKNGE